MKNQPYSISYNEDKSNVIFINIENSGSFITSDFYKFETEYNENEFPQAFPLFKSVFLKPTETSIEEEFSIVRMKDYQSVDYGLCGKYIISLILVKPNFERKSILKDSGYNFDISNMVVKLNDIIIGTIISYEYSKNDDKTKELLSITYKLL
jgi:hypothetical protein